MGIISDIPRLIIEQGNAIAEGQRQRGQIWGRTLAQLGELPGQVMAQTLALKRAQREEDEQKLRAQQVGQQLQMGGLQLAQAQREETSRQALEGALKDPNNYNADGSVNDQAITNTLRQQNVGAWQQWQTISSNMTQHALNLRKTIADIQSTEAGTQEKQQKYAQAQSEYLGNLAFNAERLLDQQPDDPLHARDTVLAGVARAAGDGAISEPQAHQFLMQTAGASPQQLKQVFGAFVPPDLRGKLEKQAADTAKAKAEAAESAAKATNLAQFGMTEPPKPNTLEDWTIRARNLATQQKGAPLSDTELRDVDTKTMQAFKEANVDPEMRQLTIAQREVATALARSKVAEGDELKDNAHIIASAIQNGTQPPDLSRLYRYAGPVRAELAKNGYDLAGAALDWDATKKHVLTMNGPQQLKLNQSINALPELLDTVEALADKWKGGRFPILNRVNLAAAKNGAYGDEVASVARQLDQQIADVTGDLATVYMGGNSPTDKGLGLASTALQSDWSEKVLRDMIALARKNVDIRRNSVNNTGVAGVSGASRYAPTPTTTPTGTPPPKGRFNPATGKIEPIS